jgi:non-ribosomal peptide synthetase component E (peptide arylation enzyme)
VHIYNCAGGWFHTGDQGFLDGDGFLTLTGRLKELINRGGEKISPIEVQPLHVLMFIVVRPPGSLASIVDRVLCKPPVLLVGFRSCDTRVRVVVYVGFLLRCLKP